MRIIEALLVSVNGLTFLLLIIAQSRATRWVGFSTAAAILLTCAQIVIEGSRWQLVPAYLLSGLFCLLWALRKIGWSGLVSATIRFHRIFVASAVVLGAVAMTISIALPIILPVFAFSRPTGPYEIGTVTYHWTDATRLEVFGKAPRTVRELMVQIWYPADGYKASSFAPYVDDAAMLSAAQARLHGIPAFSFKHLEYVTTDARPLAPIAAKQSQYPVLIFLEGITGYRQMNTFQVEELVSQGYIVVAIDQPYVAASVVFPGGRAVGGRSKHEMDPLIQQSITPSATLPILNGQPFANGIIPYLASDVSFVIDRLGALDGSIAGGILRGKLDMQRVGIFGVSLGGIVVGEACRLEQRLKACLVMDAPMSATVLRSGLRQPTMWITRDAETMRREGWAEPDIVQHQVTMRSAFEQSQGDGYFVSVTGMFHANLTDVPLYSPLTSRLGITGPIDSQRGHTIINAYSLAFFDRHLRGKPASLLERSTGPFVEVAFERKATSAR